MGIEVIEKCMDCMGRCARGYCDERKLELAGAQYYSDIGGPFNIVTAYVIDEKGNHDGLSGKKESFFKIPGGPCPNNIKEIEIRESHVY